jgi:photoactive yellow protein
MSPIPPPPSVTARTRPQRSIAAFDPTTVDDLDDAALDELPFGVVCLARDGLILRYNLAEVRLARLDPSTVVGRNFFTDVAPCANTEEFHGRFRALAEGTTGGTSVRFAYVFDFKFGAQNVDVEIVRAPRAQRLHLLINRRQFLPERTGPEAREPAPRQSDLVADEAARGILRNRYAERVLSTPVVLFELLANAFDKQSTAQWRTIAHDWGLAAGRRLVIELETAGEDEIPLGDRPMREVVELVSDLLRDQGWGVVAFDLAESARGVLRLEVESSALVGRPGRHDRCCHLLAGMLEGVLNHLAQRRLHVEELSCACTTGRPCQMIVVGESRREIAVRLAAEGRSFDEVVAALEAGRADESGG